MSDCPISNLCINQGIPTSITSYNAAVRSLFATYNQCVKLSNKVQAATLRKQQLTDLQNSDTKQISNITVKLDKVNELISQYKSMQPFEQQRLQPVLTQLLSKQSALESQLHSLDSSQSNIATEITSENDEINTDTQQGQVLSAQEQTEQITTDNLQDSLPSNWTPFGLASQSAQPAAETSNPVAVPTYGNSKQSTQQPQLATQVGFLQLVAPLLVSDFDNNMDSSTLQNVSISKVGRAKGNNGNPAYTYGVLSGSPSFKFTVTETGSGSAVSYTYYPIQSNGNWGPPADSFFDLVNYVSSNQSSYSYSPKAGT